MTRRIKCPRCHFPSLASEPIAPAVRCPYCDHRVTLDTLSTSPEPAVAVEHGSTSASSSTPASTSRMGRNPWRAFARGTGWVNCGLAIELMSLALTALAFIAAMSTSPMGERASPRLDEAIPYLALAFAAGSFAVASGRTIQAAVPAGLGIARGLRGAAILSWLQVSATLLVVSILLEIWNEYPIIQYYLGRAVLLGALASVLLRWFADITAVTSMGLVSAAMPSRKLRTRVSKAVVGSQLLGVCFAIAAVLVALIIIDRRRVLTVVEIQCVAIALFAITSAIILAHYCLQFPLYVTARRAALDWTPREALRA
ncbi:MAG TPA: hypothetical protein VLM40_08355 [Gemmata sp.]|nr:hypothetical protein [Gemmata sp.]